MYKLPSEIKKFLTISIIVTCFISIILAIINPYYIIFLLLGYISSILNLLRSNYQITSMLYKVEEKNKIGLIISNMFGMSLYFIVLLIGFYLGIVEGFIVALGIIIIKIVIILSSIFVKDGDCSWY